MLQPLFSEYLEDDEDGGDDDDDREKDEEAELDEEADCDEEDGEFSEVRQKNAKFQSTSDLFCLYRDLSFQVCVCFCVYVLWYHERLYH